MIKGYRQTTELIAFVCPILILIVSFTSAMYTCLAISENKALIEPQVTDDMPASSDTNIVLVHGAFNDGSVWSKVIPILTNDGHDVIAVQLPLYFLEGDVTTVKRAIERLEGPTILVGTLIRWRGNHKCRM